MDDVAIEVRRLSKTFAGAPALRDVSLRVGRGEMVALLGASGSGKSTLLRHLNGLHRADAGPRSVVEVLGRRVQAGGRLARDVRATRSHIAVVFQQFNLVGRLDVLTNVLMGRLSDVPTWRSLIQLWPESDLAVAMSALEQFDMGSLAAQRADQLSGGQQQRVAIARAMVQEPEIILADEPIASLDPRNTKIVMDGLLRINKHFGITVLCNLHSLDVARNYCDRLIGMAAGRIVFDGAPAALTEHIARELYDLEAHEVMGGASATAQGNSAIPAFGKAAAA